jgi:hypothetical protein
MSEATRSDPGNNVQDRDVARRERSSNHKSIEIAVRPRKDSAAICSRCHRPGAGVIDFTLWRK